MPAFRSVFVLLLLSFVPGFAGCTRKPAPVAAAPDAAPASWSTGPLSRQAPVIMSWKKAVVDPALVGSTAALRLDLKPPVKGSLTWTSPKTLEFRADGGFSPGQQYEARLHQQPGNKGKEPFTFRFGILPRTFDIELDEATASEDEGRVQVTTGRLVTSDQEDDKKVEAIVTISGDGSPDISWVHHGRENRHRFLIRTRRVPDKEGRLTIRWDGKPLGAEKSGQKSVTVAKAGDFTLQSVQAVNDGQSYIVLSFSNNLRTDQDLTGLVYSANTSFRLERSGNRILAWPLNSSRRELQLQVSASIRDESGRELGQEIRRRVSLRPLKPGVRFAGSGHILPVKKGSLIPIEAVHARAVQVSALVIPENNLPDFLQVNDLSGREQLTRSGRWLWSKTIPLKGSAEDRQRWTRYYLDADKLFGGHTGRLVNLTLALGPGYTTYPCGDNPPPLRELPAPQNRESGGGDPGNWDAYGGGWDETWWENRKNPCHPAYYHQRYNGSSSLSRRNFILSTLGIIAKGGAGDRLRIIVTDLLRQQPEPGVSVTATNYQHDEVGSCRTDSQGFCDIRLTGEPFLVRAVKGKEITYLKIPAGSALSLTHFDVGGVRVKGGIKGYLYGERGVWRPGDEIHLTFASTGGQLPDDHPVELRLYNPAGAEVSSTAPVRRSGPLHSFRLRTARDAPTGNWRAVVLYGGVSFEKRLRIETVVPNRLSLKLSFPDPHLTPESFPLTSQLEAAWLHGAPAKALNADVAVRLAAAPMGFPAFTDYAFNDQARSFTPVRTDLWKGQLDGEGRASFPLSLTAGGKPPGRLAAHFLTRVHEKGGGFSTDRFTVPFYPYKAWVGILPPRGDEKRGMLLTDQVHKVRIASVDSQGQPLDGRRIIMHLYKVKWKFWWDKTKDDSLARYAKGKQTTAVARGVVTGRDGEAVWEFEVKHPEWGRYLLRACDKESGHCSSKIVYIDWPGWAGRARKESGSGATRLALSLDREAALAGQKVTLYLPATGRGRTLVSLEKGSGILQQFWVDTKAGENRVSLNVTPQMAPNVYVHATMLQPLQDKKNDKPLRLYGVINLQVSNPASHLQPKIQAAKASWRPGETAEFTIREARDKSMHYTLAVVDEGLLGLTRFQTPDLHRAFNQREAIGVRTWDQYDDILGSFAGQLERIIAIGGDGELTRDKGDNKRRFPPMVRFYGPFALNGGKASHKIGIPNYLGAVRVMVVAATEDAWGSTDLKVPVKKEILLHAAAPALLNSGDQVRLPVTLFVTDPSVRRVRLTLQVEGTLSAREKEQTITVDGPGEQVVSFPLQATDGTGPGVIRLRAEGGGFQADQTIHMDVQAANPVSRRIIRRTVGPGKTLEEPLAAFGLPGTTSLTMEVSSGLALQPGARLDDLLRYPHGCLEQTTSAAFPQLYLPRVMDMPAPKKEQLEDHIRAAVNRLRSFQLADGSFAYWPGQQQAQPWATSWAGHFLLEARRLGYAVDDGVLERWARWQQDQAGEWEPGADRNGGADQAYRLMTLALAHKAAPGAMNRLRQWSGLQPVPALILGMAYGLTGQSEAARQLSGEKTVEVRDYREDHGTFGSGLRDRSLALMAYVRNGNKLWADKLAAELTEVVNSGRALNTQESAFLLLALLEHAGRSEGADQGFTYTLAAGGSIREISPDKIMHRQSWDTDPPGKVGITNPGRQDLRVTFYQQGVPPAGKETAAAAGLEMEVDWLNAAGNPIPADARLALAHGNDVRVRIRVMNRSDRPLKNLVLEHPFAPGLVVENPRWSAEDGSVTEQDYQDVRDERILTYFSLNKDEEKIFEVMFQAAWPGRYYMPALQVASMYDPGVYARLRGIPLEIR